MFFAPIEISEAAFLPIPVALFTKLVTELENLLLLLFSIRHSPILVIS
jgi:hypothetical protein